MPDANKPEAPTAGARAPDGTTASPGGRPLDLVAYSTVQFATGGLFDGQPVDDLIHLVRRNRRGGTPGPTLCGIDRFADDTPGWSVDGGLHDPAVTYRPCPACVTRMAPLPVTSRTWAHLFPPPTCGLCGEPFVEPGHRVVSEGPPRIVTCPTVDRPAPIIVQAENLKVYPLAGGRKCLAHMLDEPCPTCAAYIAAGL